MLKKKIEQGYSVQTAVHIQNAINAVFNHAKRKRAYSGDNPTFRVRLREMQRKETHALSFEMGRELLLLLPPVVRGMALLSMIGRSGELLPGKVRIGKGQVKECSTQSNRTQCCNGAKGEVEMDRPGRPGIPSEMEPR